MKYLKLFEQFTLENFYIKNNINPDELSYMDKGDFGTVYSIGDTDKVLKITTSYSEFEIAKQLINHSLPGFVQFYDAAEINNKYYIIGEKVDTDSRIEDLYYDLSNMLEEQNLPMQYLEYFEEDNFEINDEMRKFINAIKDINHSYRMIGIEASDLRPENLGYDNNGNLKAFDIEDRKANKRKF